jgi:hypothetical protein
MKRQCLSTAIGGATVQSTLLFGTQTVLLWLVKTTQSITSRITAANLNICYNIKIYLLSFSSATVHKKNNNNQWCDCNYFETNYCHQLVHMKQQTLHCISLLHKELYMWLLYQNNQKTKWLKMSHWRELTPGKMQLSCNMEQSTCNSGLPHIFMHKFALHLITITMKYLSQNKNRES